MLTLGIETSCDETAAAVVEGGRHIRSNVVSSQVDLHAPYGGVVPELAARSHVERLPAVVDAALARAGIAIDDVDQVAVTRGPGLVGALLVGVGFARALGFERGIPVVGVSHLDGHLHSAFLESPELELPLLVLVVSGGHTELVLMHREGEYRLLGRTLDDAAGEAFDKVARMLGLAYPGGPEVERVARTAEPWAVREFPLPEIRVAGLDFSFSGIKTAVRYRLEARLGLPQGTGLDAERSTSLDPGLVAAAAAAFQQRAVGHLARRLVDGVVETRPRTVAVAGGVAMNGALRAEVERALSGPLDAPRPSLVIPGPALCTDNAAMIAAAGHALARRGGGRDLNVDPGLRWTAA